MEKRIQSEYAEEKEKLFPRNSLICDIGGGRGEDANYFLEKGHRVIIFDSSAEDIREAKLKAASRLLDKNLITHITDLNKELFISGDNYFDIIYSRLVLHFFNTARTIEIIKDILRVLKPGGQAYISVKSPDDKEEFKFLQSEATGKLSDDVFLVKDKIKSRFNKKKWEMILNQVGIKDFKVSDYIEDLTNRGDKTKSGKMKFILYDIWFKK
jgi:ubiquinone/menaquinone biosynthesis C-methylase UbiE